MFLRTTLVTLAVWLGLTVLLRIFAEDAPKPPEVIGAIPPGSPAPGAPACSGDSADPACQVPLVAPAARRTHALRTRESHSPDARRPHVLTVLGRALHRFTSASTRADGWT